MHASLRDIKSGYRGLKRLVKKFVRSGDYSSAMTYINHCTTVASQFNWIYADDELENILNEIAVSVIDCSVTDGFQPDSDSWVFFDDYCTSYVLAMQWMTALSKTGRNILYITSQYSFENRRDKCILPEIERMANVTVKIIPDGPIFERVNLLFQSIIDVRASKVILHKAMNSLIQLPLCVLPSTITIYNINLGDQFFWLGTKHIDYNIEFRPFGASVSIQRRGFSRNQLLMIPFYPADEHRPFEGFPCECDGKIVIFSGGDYYKTWDKDNIFWTLVKCILEKYSNVVFLFATKRNTFGNEAILRFIEDNCFKDRFFYIDYRQDIFQVFANCDIYMGTTPVSGALMSQLAAINAKPILQYYAPGTPDDETEQALCINDAFPISFHTIDGFLNEADKLIRDSDYRKNQGRRLKSAMLQPEQFDQLVEKSLETNQTQLPFSISLINYSTLESRWMELENMGFICAGSFLTSLLGKYGMIASPGLFLKHKFNVLVKLLFS